MEQSITYYNRLSVFAVIALVGLVIIQVQWLRQAVRAQSDIVDLNLKQAAPDAALAVNSLNDAWFHRDTFSLDSGGLERINYTLDTFLRNRAFSEQTAFAIYQEESNRFYTNAPDQSQMLRQSDIRSCLSCIVSFSIGKSLDRLPGESDDAFSERLFSNSTFQYYSPVNGLRSGNRPPIWLTFYQPATLSSTIRSLLLTFVVNVLLLLLLLGLLYYLLRSLTRHKQLSKMRDDFFNNVTHEFKTPLASIRLASRVLRQSTDPTKNATYHQLIERESQRLEQQVDDLLHLSLLENKKLQLEQKPVEVFDVLRRIPSRLAPLIEEKDAQLELDLEAAPSERLGDVKHLSNSFCNLVENSLKYGPTGVKIRISARAVGEKLQIIFTDNGPGIDPAYRPYIFDRFYRGKKEHQYKGKGFGIGLSYVRHIIESHGGNIRLNTQVYPGCEFNIEL